MVKVSENVTTALKFSIALSIVVICFCVVVGIRRLIISAEL